MSKHLAFFIFFLLFLPVVGGAQELPPPQQSETKKATEVTPEKFVEDPNLPFTGALTFEEVEPDEKELTSREEKELFGEEEDEEEEIQTGATHLLKFDFTSRIEFIHQPKMPDDPAYTGRPYMEIEYKTNFEMPITILPSRKREKTEAEYEIRSSGNYFENEFVVCELNITMREIPVEIITRLQKITEGEENEESTNLALKIKFDKETKEDWYSNCTDIAGSTLNTQGDPEDYNYQVLSLIDPSLAALVVENFDPASQTKINLNVDPNTVNDNEISNDIVLSGEGEVTIEPI